MIIIVLISTNITFPNLAENLNNKLVDFMFHIRGEIKGSEQIIIIDIDDASIEQYGQWPWSRDIIAEMIEILTTKGAGIIGLDIVFAEYDRTSPAIIASKINCSKNQVLENYDEILANTLQQSPVILGYQFELKETNIRKQNVPLIPAIFIEKNKPNNEKLLTAKGMILNNKIIQSSAYSSGFFNNIPDESGVTRAVPLVIQFKNIIYPSLALEMVRAAYDIKKVIINYNDLGIENIQLGDFFIPTDRYGRMLINFRGKEHSYRYISAKDILENKINSNDLEGKILFVGTSAVGLSDLRAIPFEPVFPGVEIHANIIDNILNQNFLTLPYWIDTANTAYVIMLTMLTMLLMRFSSINYMPIVFALLFSLIVLTNYYIIFYEFILINTFFPLFALFLSLIASLFINYFFETKQKEIIKQRFSSKVSKAVMEDILKNNNEDFLSAKDKEITIFFSDIREFTSISEKMGNPREIIMYLNRYLNPVTEIIISYEGTIDKYIGDSVMAYWNAPADVLNHQDKALICALHQLKFLQELNKNLAEENLPMLEIGIGINSGLVTVGEMGSQQRSDYTVIGDPVNLGSRLESLCKKYGASIIISEFVKNNLKDKYIIRDLDLVQVKGKSKPVEIFEVIDLKENPQLITDNLEFIIDEINQFNTAISFYRQSDFIEAKNILTRLQSISYLQSEKIFDIYLKRCNEFINNPPDSFDAIFVHYEKG